MKPIIGIIEWPYIDKDQTIIYEVNKEIVEKISAHGGRAVGIFPTQIEDYIGKRLSDIKSLTEIEKGDIESSIQMCDAIIKPGAYRIYGYEKYLIDKALERKMPFLGICAGMQAMANYGKDEIQNNIKNDSIINHNVNSQDAPYAHKIIINRLSKLYSILKKEEIRVNSRHNYHIPSSGKFAISACAEDAIPEAIENPQHGFQIGLQWHPESLEDENSDRLFEAFIKEAAKQKIKKLY